MTSIILPSLYNANPLNLDEALNIFVEEKISALHIDIMDGHFVPSLGLCPTMIDALRENYAFNLDCHLMIEKPENNLDFFIAKKPDCLTFHYEATAHHFYLIDSIKRSGIKIGIAINPSTSVDVLETILPFLDLVLIMTVNPGRNGQSFIPSMYEKIKKLHRLKLEHGYHFKIQVDGNVSDKNIQQCVQSGVDLVVSGGFIFQNNQIRQNIQQLNKMLGEN